MTGRAPLPIALAVLALGLTSCAPAPTAAPPSPGASTPAAPTVVESTPPTTAPDPEPTESVVTVTPDPTTSATQAGPPSEPPPAPTAPAETTAGGLTETDVAQVDGWLPTARPGSPEEGFMGNGTWVHATSAEHSAFGAMALGCTEVGEYPNPVAALEGNLTDGAGRPGIGLTLEFADAADAQAYFAEWLRQAEACVGTATERISATADTWVGKRNLGTVWSETAGLRGETVRFLIVDSADADLRHALDGAR